MTSAEKMDWWRFSRFGIFIHWGPASVAGVEISWGRVGHPHDIAAHEIMPAAIYDRLYEKFNPTQFDADAWVRLAIGAGAGYLVFVTKHHDGFSMWPTKLSLYNITATPFKRDICKEIAEACRRHGMRLGWYYSTRDWTHPDYLVGDNAAYNDFYEAQIRELLTDYGKIDLIWFDHVAGNWRDYRFEQLFHMMRELQPDILINDRAAKFVFPTDDSPTPEIAELVKGDFETPEQRVGGFQIDRDWESCVTLTECADGGGWSHRPDGRTRSVGECTEMLVKCSTGGGNLLLNVAPTPEGQIEPNQADVLRGVGRWLDRNSSSIRDSRGGPTVNGPWGGTTWRGNKIFVHVLRWPDPALTLVPITRRVISIDGPVKWTQDGDRVTVTRTDSLHPMPETLTITTVL